MKNIRTGLKKVEGYINVIATSYNEAKIKKTKTNCKYMRNFFFFNFK